MAYIELHQEKLRHNFEYLQRLFTRNDIQWGVVSKLLCGNREYLKVLLDLGIMQILDSRLSNLRVVKHINPEIVTMYIRPPSKRSIKSVIKYADISMNTESATIMLLSEEAQRQKKKHKVMIMIEMGDLREGVVGEKVVQFYEKIFELPYIEVVGIGTNLNCLSGVLPNPDKLIQLSLYEQLIEAKFNKSIPFVSGGTSITIPLIMKKMLPVGINHFRIGETLYLGNNLFTGKSIRAMKQNVFMLYTEIIELMEKPLVPTGEIAANVAGEVKTFDESDYGKTSYRAILDIGLLDIDTEHLIPVDKKVEFSGASSDMIVIDLGSKKPKYKVGDLIAFKLDYLGVLSILNSKYIEKKVV